MSSNSASALEEPKFSIELKDGDIEIRNYESMIVAEVEVDGDFDKIGNEGFKKVASYIFGGNSKDQKISMTAPVNMQAGPSTGKVWFYLPSEYTMDSLPKPSNKEVRISVVSGRKVAALRYSGSWSKDLYDKKKVELESWLEKQNRKTKSPFVFARYNSPFSLWFLRRNEVLVDIE